MSEKSDVSGGCPYQCSIELTQIIEGQTLLVSGHE